MQTGGITTFAGRLSEGETAASRTVSVVLTQGGLSICDETGRQIAFWPYEVLRAGTPISKSDVDLLLKRKDDPRATLFVQGDGLGTALIARAPFVSSRHERAMTFRYGMLATVLILAAGAFLFFSKYRFARTVADIIPFETAQKLGRASAASFGAACTQPQGVAALQKMLDRLQSSANVGEPFTMTVAKWQTENAFALPGRNIVLLSGLVEHAKSPEEVAGVIAHEMGHGLEKDPEAAYVRAVGFSILVQIVSGASENAAGLGALLLQLRYSREAERTADAHSVEILKAARIAPTGVADFLARHDAGTGPFPDRNSLAYLSTHPASAERVKFLKQTPPYKTEPVLTDAEWKAAQGVCGARHPEPETDPEAELRTVLESDL